MSKSFQHALAAILFVLSSAPSAADDNTLRIAYLTQARELPPALSNLDVPPENEGQSGAEVGIADNNTTGKFTKQKFELITQRLAADADAAAAVQAMHAKGVHFIVLDLHREPLEKAARAAAALPVLLFNAQSPDVALRLEACQSNLLHTIPSRAMRSDALAQYLVKKRWTEWFLIPGPRPEDALFADAVRRSAKKFGAKIVAEKAWTGEHDARRTAQAEIPLFTQAEDYDVLIVADEIGDFGDYLEFRTWLPRPVAGTQGMVSTAWGRAVEQWGATQLQERFLAHAGRWMRPRDYASWVAVRTVGEAALRSRSLDYEKIRAYIQSDKFKLAAFKGRKMNYRSWNGQLRQPMMLLTPRSLVAQAPLEGFLHQHTELDTLGIDEPESRCTFN